MPDPADVASVLARLADQAAPYSPDHRGVVADAETAFRDVETAATFLDRGGERRLKTAVALATRRGDDAVAARGASLLDSLERYRSAAQGAGTPDPPVRTSEETGAGSSSETGDEAVDDRGDQFRPARTTLLGGDGIPTDR